MGEFNAQVWAHAFATAVELDLDIITNEDTLAEWFSGAIMTGYDVGISDSIKRVKEAILSEDLPMPRLTEWPQREDIP